MGSESLFDELPPGWIATTLGEACEQTGGNIQTGPFGSQLHASDYVDVGIPSIMPQDIGENRIETASIKCITLADAKRLDRYLVRPGDIVLSRRGDVRRRALIREREDGWLCGTGSLRIRFGDGNIDSAYVSYYLGHPIVADWIVRHAHGATMPNLNTSILSALPLLLPPLPEQRAIAHILGTLDDKIELNRRMNATLEAMARALFKSWFVDFDPVWENIKRKEGNARAQRREDAKGEEGLRALASSRLGVEEMNARAQGRKGATEDLAAAHPGAPSLPEEILALFPDAFEESALGLIPQGWRVGRVADLGKIITGKTPPTRNPENYGKDIPFITIPDMHGRVFATQTRKMLSVAGAETQINKYLPKYSICVSCIATPGLVVITSERAQTNQQINSVIPFDQYSPFYCYEVLSQLGEQIRAGGSGGSVFANLNKTRFSNIQVILAQPSAISTFHAIVEPVFERILTNDLESRTLAGLRDTLLPRLISGELRVGDAERFLAEAGV